MNSLTKKFLLSTVLGSTLMLSTLVGVRADDASKPSKTKPAETKQDTPAQEPAAVDEDYAVGVDVILALSATGHEDLTQVVSVLSDGKIYVAGVKDPIKAVGKTLPELRKEISTGLARLYNNVELSVSIKEIGSRYVSVIGGRGAGGRFPFRKDMKVSTLISLAGTPAGKTKYVVGSIQRNYERIKLDMQKIIGQNPDSDADILLQNKDALVMDLKEEAPAPTYSVLGAVAKGGSFPMPLDGSPITIARAIAEAGGKNQVSALTKVVLQRHGKEKHLNLYPLLSEGRADAIEGNITMEDGDVLIIPEIKTKYMVLGQANKPGSFPMPEEKQITVLEALAEAGGANGQGEQRKATLLRTVNGKRELVQLNLMDMQSKGKLEKNYVINDGDIIFIPMRGQQVNPTDFLNPLFLLTNVFSTARSLGR